MRRMHAHEGEKWHVKIVLSMARSARGVNLLVLLWKLSFAQIYPQEIISLADGF